MYDHMSTTSTERQTFKRSACILKRPNCISIKLFIQDDNTFNLKSMTSNLWERERKVVIKMIFLTYLLQNIFFFFCFFRKTM
jgi:hypothetical protein